MKMYVLFSLPSLILCVVTCRVVTGYPAYQMMIPNGEFVPNVCDRSQVWMGVGHRNPNGGGHRNPFGLHFANSNYNWSRICRLDSDNDGRTNGQELGDPNCRWQPGMESPASNRISHPGICEPTDSATCSIINAWLSCPEPVNCSEAIRQTGILQKQYRFPPTPVPAARNSHYCFGFNHSSTIDFQQLVAVQPVLDNRVVMHHMNLWGCTHTPNELYTTPKPCERTSACRRFIRLWTIGEDVECTASARLGSRLDRSTYTYAIIELHWRNAKLSREHADSSGLTMYYNDVTAASDSMTSQSSPLNSAAVFITTAVFHFAVHKLK